MSNYISAGATEPGPAPKPPSLLDKALGFIDYLRYGRSGLTPEQLQLQLQSQPTTILGLPPILFLAGAGVGAYFLLRKKK